MIEKPYLVALLLAMVSIMSACDGDKAANSASSANESAEHAAASKLEFAAWRDSLIAATPELKEVHDFREQHRDSYEAIAFTFMWESARYYVPVVGYDANETPMFKKAGLLNSMGTELLPVVFDRLYTPNKIMPQCMEVQKSGKQGLIDRNGNFLLQPEYEQLFPGFADYLVCMRTENGYAYFGTDSVVHTVSVEEEAIFLAELYAQPSTQHWQFDVNSDVPFIGLQELLQDVGDPTGSGYYYPPEFLVDFGLIKAELTNILIGDDESFGEANTRTSITSSHRNDKGFWVLLGKFFMELPESRGYMEEQRTITAVKDNGTTSHQRFTYGNDFNACHENLKFRVIADTLFEASFNAPAKGAFRYIETYSYCSIQNGEVIELPSNRSFAFTQYVTVDSTYFEGCWWKPIGHEDSELPNTLSYNHLTPEDLDIMRNEIYADYAYRFKSEKWQQYFSQFDWYTPRHDNVDDQITPLEKANIEYIVRYKSWLQKHVNEIIEVDSISWLPAG